MYRYMQYYGVIQLLILSIQCISTFYHTMQDEESDDSDSSQELQDTRKWLTEQNRKKKKSGGFQSMGKETLLAEIEMADMIRIMKENFSNKVINN